MGFQPDENKTENIPSRRGFSVRGEKERQTAEKKIAEARFAARVVEAAGGAAEKAERLEICHQDKLLRLVELGREAAKEISKKQSVIRLRDWQRKAKDLGAQESGMGAFDRLLAERCGLVRLSAEQKESPWDVYAFSWSMAVEEEMIQLAGLKRKNGWGLREKSIEKAIEKKKGISEEQEAAVRACCSGEEMVKIIEGTAGAGKSFSMEAVKEVYEDAGYDVCGAAPSWTAAMVLAESAKLPGGAKAIDKILVEAKILAKKGEDYFKRKTLLICDESGMVGAQKMRDLFVLASSSKHPVRIVLTGDSLQLGPVEPGNALEALVIKYGSTRINEIRRQRRASHRAAIKKFSEGNAAEGLWTFWQQERIKLCSSNEERFSEMIKDYCDFVVSNPEKVALALALRNNDVAMLNGAIRGELKKIGRISGPEYKVKVTDARSVWEEKLAVGDLVVFRKNVVSQPIYKSQFASLSEAYDGKAKERVAKEQGGLFKSLLKKVGFAKEENPVGKGVFNRTSGVILDIKENRQNGGLDITVLLPGGVETRINTKDFVDDDERDDGRKPSGALMIHHNFATTIYASQGQTVDRVFMADSPMMNRRLAYVGMSRHREAVDIYVDMADLRSRMERDRGRRADKLWRDYSRATALLDRAKADEGETFSLGRRNVANKSELAKRLRDSLRDLKASSRKEPRVSDLLEEMARQWSSEAPNMTAFTAKAHIEQGVFEKPKDECHYPRRGKEDDPDDIEQRNLEKEREHFESAKKAATAQIAQAMGMDTESVEALYGEAWALGKEDEPRFLAADPDGEIVSRYSMAGKLVAGDGEPPILVNWASRFGGDSQTFVIAEGLREGVLLKDFFEKKMADDEASIPNIVLGLKEAELSFLNRWTAGFEYSTIRVAWSPKKPESLTWAEETMKKIKEAGFEADYWPKHPSQNISRKP